MKIEIFFNDKSKKSEVLEHVTRIVQMGEFINVTTDKNPTLRNYHFRRNLITKRFLGVSEIRVKHEHKLEILVQTNKVKE